MAFNPFFKKKSPPKERNYTPFSTDVPPLPPLKLETEMAPLGSAEPAIPIGGQKSVKEKAEARKSDLKAKAALEPVGALHIGFPIEDLEDLARIADILRKSVEDLRSAITGMEEALKCLEDNVDDVSKGWSLFADKFYGDSVTQAEFDRSIQMIIDGVTVVASSAWELARPCRRLQALLPEIVQPLNGARLGLIHAQGVMETFHRLLEGRGARFSFLVDHVVELLPRKIDVTNKLFSPPYSDDETESGDEE